MANNIKGITIEIGGDTTKLQNALKGVNGDIKSTKNELKEVEKGLKLDPKNTELLAQKQQLLTKAVGETKDKLDVLKTAEAQVEQQFKNGEASEEQYRAIKREVIATEAELKNLEEQAKASNSTLAKVGDAFGTVGDKATKAGEKMMPVTAGITALGAAGVAASMELDNGYDTIITKTGATGEALESLTTVADNVFSDMPTTMDDVGVAVGEVNARFGATGTELENLSKEFIKFANINGTDLNTAIDSVDSIMTKFGVDASQTKNVLGLMTKAGQDTGISMETLETALTTNGASLKEMGLDLTSSVNLLAQMEASGVDVSTALAGMKKAVQNATADGKSADEALTETIDSIKNAKTETEALTIASDLFGKKGAAEMTQAIREGRLSVDDLSGALSDYGDVVSDTFETTLDPWDDAAVAMNNLKLAGADLGSSILTTLQPTIDKVVNKVKEFTTWFKNLDDNTKQMIVKIGMIVAAIGPALIIFGKMSTGISGVIKTVTGLTSKIGGMSGVLSALTGPVGIVIAIIAALAAGFIALYKTNDEFKEKVDGTIGKVKDAFSQMWTTIQPLLESLKQAFINLMAALKPVFEFVLTYIASIVNGVINAAAPIIAAIQNVIDFVTNIINAIIALLHGDFDGFFSYLQGAFNSAISFVKNIIQAVINFIIGFLEGFGVNVKTLFTNIWNSIVAVFQGVGQWFSDRFTEAWNAITTIFSAIGSWFAARWNDIKTALATVATWFLTMFTNAYTNVTNVFAAIGSWFAARWNDIKTALAAVATWFLTMFTNAYTNVTNVFAAIGSWFGARWTEIKTALASVPTWFKTQFDNAWTNIKNAFANVTSFFSDLWEKIKGCFVNVGVAIGSAVGDAFKSAINSCLSTIEGVVNKFIGMINGVIGIINKIPGVSLSKIDTLSLPRLAKGGVLREGTAMVAEAGPELLSMVNGKAVVTPLTGSAVNTAADNLKGNNRGFHQEINITSPKALSPYEVARQTRIQTRAMVIAMQRG